MNKIWQEIDRLNKIVADLERKLARQDAVLAQSPGVRVGDIVQVDDSGTAREYTLQERTVDEALDQAIIGVKILPGDSGPPASMQPVAFGMDSASNYFVLPAPGQLILIEDQGSGQGKHCEKNSAGVVNYPAGAETLDMIVAEPTTQFHGGDYPTEAGRIYPGMKLTAFDGTTRYYLIFLAGYGDDDYNHDVTIDGATLRIVTDYAGKFKSISLA